MKFVSQDARLHPYVAGNNPEHAPSPMPNCFYTKQYAPRITPTTSQVIRMQRLVHYWAAGCIPTTAAAASDDPCSTRHPTTATSLSAAIYPLGPTAVAVRVSSWLGPRRCPEVSRKCAPPNIFSPMYNYTWLLPGLMKLFGSVCMTEWDRCSRPCCRLTAGYQQRSNPCLHQSRSLKTDMIQDVVPAFTSD